MMNVALGMGNFGLTIELFCCVICSADINSAIDWSSMAYALFGQYLGTQLSGTLRVLHVDRADTNGCTRIC